MALETLKGIREIDGFAVNQDADDFCQGEMQGMFYNEEFIVINHEDNSITFKIQDGPIKEVGVNGCQVDQLVHVAKLIIDKLNDKFPCMCNQMAVQGLDEVLTWLRMRKEDRVTHGVEGRNKA